MKLQICLPEQSDDDMVQIEAPTRVIAEVIGFWHNKEGFPRWSLNPKGLHFSTSPDDFVYIELKQKETGEVNLLVGYEDGGDILDISLQVTSVEEIQDFPSITTR